MPDIPAGWYNDPARPGHVRWWDGINWSDATHPVPAGTGTAGDVVGQRGDGIPRSRRPAWFVWVAIVMAAILVFGGGATLAVQVVTDAFSEVAKQQRQPQQETAPGTYTNGTSTSPPVPAPVVTKLTLPNIPGDVREVSAGGILTQESSEFTVETGTAERQKINLACSPLTFDAPLAGGTRNSVNPVESFPGYASDDGTTSLTGALQAFATAKDAENFMDEMTGLLQSCKSGFDDGGGSDSISRTTASYPGDALNSWKQTIHSSAGSFTVGIVDIRDGRFVARSYCRQSSTSSESAALCAAWTSAVAGSAASAG
jgi:Protein of unknown function (DUF2510)